MFVCVLALPMRKITENKNSHVITIIIIIIIINDNNPSLWLFLAPHLRKQQKCSCETVYLRYIFNVVVFVVFIPSLFNFA